MPPLVNRDRLDDEAVLADLKQHIAADLELTPDEIARVRLDAPLVESLSLDSLRQVVLLTRLEEEYGFEFDADDLDELETIVTIRDLVRIIRRRAATLP
jgi:acyl carrier protein